MPRPRSGAHGSLATLLAALAWLAPAAGAATAQDVPGVSPIAAFTAEFERAIRAGVPEAFDSLLESGDAPRPRRVAALRPG